MKIKEKYLIYCLLLFLNISLLSTNTFAQTWEGANSGSVSNEWIFNANFGLMSYFGDLSIYDQNISAKIENESGRAGGIMITKRIIKPFGLSVQLISGNLKARKSNIYFESAIFEYNLSAYIDLLSLLKISKNEKIGFQVFGGVGNFLFNSTKYEYYEGETITTKHKSRVPEFVAFMGAGLSYKFSDKFGIMSALSLKQCQNDKIDVFYKQPDFDYYSYFQFGITFHLKPVNKAYVHNRARIAHTNTGLKPLK